MKQNRAKALEWWRTLSKNQKQQIANKHFPDKEFIAISTSSNRIECIYKKENKLR